MPIADFSAEELHRYSRHFSLPEFGVEGQRVLKNARVLVVGAGGLGNPVSMYLAAAGVGTLGIVDFDTVEASNLQRQVAFETSDVGKLKAECLAQRITSLNPHITIKTYLTRLTSDNAKEIIAPYQVVVDGTDNFPTRYLLNDLCVFEEKTLIYGSIYQFEGQVSVFNHKKASGERGTNYRDLFPSPPPPEWVPNCAEGGVLGVLPGIIGSLQASETLKVLTGMGEPLAGRLLLFDALQFTMRIMRFEKDPANPLTGSQPTITSLIDYEAFCQLSPEASEKNNLPSLSVEELYQKQQKNEPFTLLDVREPYEYEIANLGGMLIPQHDVEANLYRIPKDEPVVVHCRTGKRSAAVVRMLCETFGYDQVYNLEGGILAWAQRIDSSITQY